MMRLTCVALLSLAFSLQAAFAEDPVFSGPQPGEVLPALKVNGVFGDHADKEFDLIAVAEGKPVCVVFFQKRTRPAFALANAVMRYAATRKKDGLVAGTVFLTADATETGKWMHVVDKNLPKGVEMAISPDGQEGPGAYGLNRNVTLTILVGKEGKVLSNFALVQPSVQADGQKILKAIVGAVGGDVPDINQFAGPRYRGMRRPNARNRNDPELTGLLRAVINKQATKEQVDDAAGKVEAYVEKKPAAARELGRITNTVVNSDKLGNYGTAAAQEYLKKWAKKYPAPAPREKTKPSETEKKQDSPSDSSR